MIINAVRNADLASMEGNVDFRVHRIRVNILRQCGVVLIPVEPWTPPSAALRAKWDRLINTNILDVLAAKLAAGSSGLEPSIIERRLSRDVRLVESGRGVIAMKVGMPLPWLYIDCNATALRAGRDMRIDSINDPRIAIRLFPLIVSIGAYWLVAMCLHLGWQFALAQMAQSRRTKRRCVRCRYDLMGTRICSGVTTCPECGAVQ